MVDKVITFRISEEQVADMMQVFQVAVSSAMRQAELDEQAEFMHLARFHKGLGIKYNQLWTQFITQKNEQIEPPENRTLSGLQRLM